MSDIESKLNQVCNDYFRSIEKELNKNTVPFGDLQPGNLYHVPIINKLGEGKTVVKRIDNSILEEVPTKIGHIKDIQVREDDIKIIKISDYIGYMMVTRIIAGSLPVDNLKYIMQDLLFRLKKELGFDHNILNTGDYYIKINGFTEEENISAFKLEIESCCMSNISIDILVLL